MSLINDALKRARDTQQTGPPSGAPPLPPVEPPARGGNSWILALAAVLFLAAAGLFIGMALFQTKTPPAAVAQAPKVSAPQTVASVPVSAPASNVLSAPPGASTQPAAVPELWPKVQGIIYNAANPEAIVNGKTVGVGDRVGNFSVKQILKDGVIFQRPDGSEKKLAIGG